MQQLAATLQNMVAAPVVDRTGLTGAFDVDLQWTPIAGMMSAPAGDGAADGHARKNDGPSIFTAVQEQLGLKLAARKDPFEVVVIDRIARPAAN